MANVGDLVVKLKADAKDLEDGLTSAQDRLKKTGDKMKGIGKGLSAGITAPIAGIGMGAIMTGANFEKGMKRVQALTGSTAEEFNMLRDRAKELGASTAFSATQSSEAMGFLAMAGFKTTDIYDAMPQVLNLAAAAQIDLGEAADIASNILTGFGLETSELTKVNDALVKAMTSANVDLTMLGESMKYVGPVAASAGMDFNETAAAVALLGNAGIQGSMAGTSLRGAMTRLLKPTEEAEGIMRKLGIQAMDGSGNLKGFTEIVGELEKANISTADAMAIFGQRAGPAMMALVSQGSEALGDMTKSLDESGGTAERIADTQLEGMSGAVVEMKSAFEGLMIALSEDLLPILTSLIDTVTPLIQKFANAPAPIKKIVLVVGLLAAGLGPLLIVVGMMIPAITALSGVMTGLSLSMGPITLAIVGIAAAITAGIIIWKNWDKIVAGFKKTWDFVWKHLEKPVKVVFNALKGYINMWISAVNLIISGLNKISVKVPKWVPKFGGKGWSFNIPEIPKLAEGGIVNDPTLAMIGEKGPEAVIPLDKAGGVGTTLVVNITGPTYGFDDFEQKVSKAIRDGVRRGGFKGILNT